MKLCKLVVVGVAACVAMKACKKCCAAKKAKREQAVEQKD